MIRYEHREEGARREQELPDQACESEWPKQPDQPLQGVHPPGAERSALARVLDGERVMPGDLGLRLRQPCRW
jgi:hypothetical protein